MDKPSYIEEDLPFRPLIDSEVQARLHASGGFLTEILAEPFGHLQKGEQIVLRLMEEEDDEYKKYITYGRNWDDPMAQIIKLSEVHNIHVQKNKLIIEKPRENEEASDMELAMFLIKHIDDPCEDLHGNNIRGFYIREAQKALNTIHDLDAKTMLEEAIRKYSNS